MENKIGILLIHGIGSEHNKKFVNFIKGVKRIIEAKNIKYNNIHIKKVLWKSEISSKQKELWNNVVASDFDLNFKRLRKFIIENVGDAIGYLGVPNKSGCNTYNDINILIYRAIYDLEKKLNQPDAPLIIVASSFGTLIISNYIYDRQNFKGTDFYGKTAFQQFETLTGFFTFGCNLPLFSVAFSDNQLKVFQFPSPKLPEKHKNNARWFNIFNGNDILAFPLKSNLKSLRKNPYIEDIQINISSILTGWNPGVHLKYWFDKSIQKLFAHYVISLIEEKPFDLQSIEKKYRKKFTYKRIK